MAVKKTAAIEKEMYIVATSDFAENDVYWTGPMSKTAALAEAKRSATTGYKVYLAKVEASVISKKNKEHGSIPTIEI